MGASSIPNSLHDVSPHTLFRKVEETYHTGRRRRKSESDFGVEGAMKIDRRDFGMTWSATLDTGGLVVGNDVTIDLNIEAVKK